MLRDERFDSGGGWVDLQAHVPEEMSTFSQEIDLKEIVEKVQKAIGRGGLLDKLFLFAALEDSPDPGKLASDAAASSNSIPSPRFSGRRIWIEKAR